MERKNKFGELVGSRSEVQQKNDDDFKALALRQIENSGENWAIHCMAVLKRNTLARVLYMDELYREIVTVPGVICEFGVQWGAGMATLLNLRNLYEPYNVERFIYGFDTFEGFPSVGKDDPEAEEGDYSTELGYEKTLQKILAYHESISAFQDRQMFEIVKGDASQTIDRWLDENPGATIALAIFDMDLYQPTKVVLEKIAARLTRQSVVVFDEFCHRKFPGEVKALREVFNLMDMNIKRSIHHSQAAICRFGV